MGLGNWFRGAMIAAMLVASVTAMAQPAHAVFGVYYGGFGGGSGFGYRGVGIGFGRSVGYSNYGYGSSYYRGYGYSRAAGFGYSPSYGYSGASYSPSYSYGYAGSAATPTGLFFGYGGRGRYGFFPRLRSAAVRFHDRIHSRHYNNYAYAAPAYSSYSPAYGGAWSSYPVNVVFQTNYAYSPSVTYCPAPTYYVGDTYYVSGCGVTAPVPACCDSAVNQVSIQDSATSAASYEYGPVTTHDESVLEPTKADDLKKPSKTKGTESLPEPKGKGEGKGKKAPKGRLGLELHVPADATVFVDGYETKSTGEVRRFMTGVVKEGRAYDLEVRVECEREGKQLVIQRTVQAFPGFVKTFEFDVHQPTMVTVNVPEDARVFVAGQETRSTGSVRTFATADLAPGDTWSDYEVRVELDRDGRTISKSERLRVVAGRNQSVTFAFDAGTLVARAK